MKTHTRACGVVARAAAMVVVLSGSQVSSAGVKFYAGPSYDAPSGSGYTNASFLNAPGSSAGNGFGTGTAHKVGPGEADLGPRAIRLNTGGWTELGTLGTRGDGYTHVGVWGVNADGASVGTSGKYSGNNTIGTRAVRWDAGSAAPTELDTLGTSRSGYAESTAHAINAAGTAVGNAMKYDRNLANVGFRAVRWDVGGTSATELGNLGTANDGFAWNNAFAINSAGTAVGTATKHGETSPRGYRAVRWDAGTTVATELGSIGASYSGQTVAMAYAINTGGTAIGFAEKRAGDNNFGDRAVRWDAGGTAATELGHLGTDNRGNTQSRANSINTYGAIVGFAQKHNAGTYLGTRAVRWDAGTTAAIELGNLGTSNSGITTGQANAINDAGFAVGFMDKWADGVSLGNRAVYWDLDGVAIDLNALLSPADAMHWTLTIAKDISNTNWITGIGSFDPDGAAGALPAYDRMFLIQIPTPGAAAALALVGLFAAKRRRR